MSGFDFHGLTASFDGERVIGPLSFRINEGEHVGLVGKSGAGKSTLLHLLQGRLSPSSGQVACDGMPVQSCRDRVVLMPQRGRIDWSFPITVREFVALGEMGNSSFGCCDREAALQRVGLETLATRRLDALSGGQQQRALLARTLVQPSRVLLLDEPCAAIDPPSREQLIALMRQLADSGQTLLVSNHDWGAALDLFDRVIVLDGSVVADGCPEQVRRILGRNTASQESCHE